MKEGSHVPVTSQLPAAPDDILEITHSGCKTGCKQQQCTAAMYSCLRYGTLCRPGCVNCTENCENRADADDKVAFRGLHTTTENVISRGFKITTLTKH